jgi:3',5'-nucleoside bisphosphate phosphatase
MVINKNIVRIAFLLLGLNSIVAQDRFFNADADSFWISTDLHIHTVFSDGEVWPSIRVKEAQREGLDLIAMTEHLEYQPHSEDIPHPDRNRSFIVASSQLADGDALQVINGSEITREMPPGHINAVFIKDANMLLHSDSLTGIQEANKQGAFVFWNHPNWDAQRADGIARLDPFHKYLIRNKLLHGIEVVNETTYSEEALQIALDNDLAILGTSDIHGLTDWAHEIGTGGHRPMTFVKVAQPTPEAVKEALFQRKTVVWYNDLIIGNEESISQIVNDNIHFGSLRYDEDKTILNVQVTNESSLPFHMEYLGDFSFHKRTTIFKIPAKSSIELQIKTKTKKKSVELPFKILNAVIGPKKYLEYQFTVK